MQDPLDISIPVAGVDTSIPLLPEADYDFQIVESIPKVNKKGTGYNWNLKLALLSPATSMDGRTINPGFPVFHLVALQASEDAKDPEGFRRGIGDTIDAILGTNKDTRPDFNKSVWESAVGRTVKAHIVIENFEGRDSNKVKRLKKA